SKPVIGFRKPSERRIESVEHDSVAAIADRVDVDLESALKREVRPRSDVLWSRDEQSRVGRLTTVRREERRPAGAERSVGVELDGANPQRPVMGRPSRAEL